MPEFAVLISKVRYFFFFVVAVFGCSRFGGLTPRYFKSSVTELSCALIVFFLFTFDYLLLQILPIFFFFYKIGFVGGDFCYFRIFTTPFFFFVFKNFLHSVNNCCMIGSNWERVEWVFPMLSENLFFSTYAFIYIYICLDVIATLVFFMAI